MDTVLITAYDRPEYLKIMLELIQQADRAEENLYIFALDDGYNPKNEIVISQFPFAKAVIKMPHERRFGRNYITKQSRNVLNGYINACIHSDEFVFNIEDDILIGKDFFTFSKKLLRHEKSAGACIMTKNHNTAHNETNNPNAYFLTDNGDYQSWGVCWRKLVIENIVKKHYNSSYLHDPKGYCMREWPNSKIGSGFCEQDGLIRRNVEKDKIIVAFPHVPRAYHSGLYGYHRQQPKLQSLPFEAKVKALKEIIFNPEKMKEWDNIYFDSKPCDLNTSHKGELIKIDC